MTNHTNNRGHRHRIEIDFKQFDGFCMIQCSLTEIAAFFNCSEDTIERRVKEEYGITFAEYFSKKRVAGLVSLRRNLFKMSEKQPAVAIFLAKNWLGMSDKQEVEHSGHIGKNAEELSDAELARIITTRGLKNAGSRRKENYQSKDENISARKFG